MGSVHLDALLKVSRQKNMKSEITGFLLFDTSVFMQLLEGPKRNVEMLFSIIQKDKRHKSVYILHDGMNATRSFPMWSMAYQLIGNQKLIATGGSLSTYALKGLVLQLQKKSDDMSIAMSRYITTFLNMRDKTSK